MALAGQAKTGRRAKRSLAIQNAICEALADGPVSASKMHDMLYTRFDIEPYSSLYHAKCAGVHFLGKNPRTRVWELSAKKRAEVFQKRRDTSQLLFNARIGATQGN